jgi:hypothetical protein
MLCNKCVDLSWVFYCIAMPIFDVKPLDAVRAEDEDVEFECRASGIPAPTLSWLSNGRPLSCRCLVRDMDV